MEYCKSVLQHETTASTVKHLVSEIGTCRGLSLFPTFVFHSFIRVQLLVCIIPWSVDVPLMARMPEPIGTLFANKHDLDLDRAPIHASRQDTRLNVRPRDGARIAEMPAKHQDDSL